MCVLYVCSMMKCLKCQKEYIPKRMGGLFCKPSHGNAYRQQLKRDEQKKAKLVEQGQAVEKELTAEEVELWSTMLDLSRKARQIMLDRELPEIPADLPMRIYYVLSGCRQAEESPVMKSIGARFEAQKKARKAREEQNKSE